MFSLLTMASSCALDCQDIQEFYASEEFSGRIIKLDNTVNFNGKWIMYLSNYETVQINSTNKIQRALWRNSSLGDSIVKFKGDTFLELVKEDSAFFKYKYYLDCIEK